MKLNIKLLVGSLFLVTTSAFAHDHPRSPAESPSATASASPSPSPTPACSDADLATHLSCLAACDAAASSACSSQGALSHFGAFLVQASASCSFPAVDKKHEYSKLQELVQSLRKIGAISSADSKLIRAALRQCRKSLEHDHGNHGHH